jgi:hypothetical protein
MVPAKRPAVVRKMAMLPRCMAKEDRILEIVPG